MTLSTVALTPGVRVATTLPVGEDFGLQIVEPTKALERPGRKGLVWREVRNAVHARGGMVVWFTDGTKTSPIHGRTGWISR